MPRVNGDCVIRGFQHQDAGDSISLWCPPTYPAVSHRPASNPFHVVVAFLILSLHIMDVGHCGLQELASDYHTWTDHLITWD